MLPFVLMLVGVTGGIFGVVGWALHWASTLPDDPPKKGYVEGFADGVKHARLEMRL